MTTNEEIISQEKQQELLEKYDPDAATRKLGGKLGWIVFFGLLAFSVFQLYTDRKSVV